MKKRQLSCLKMISQNTSITIVFPKERKKTEYPGLFNTTCRTRLHLAHSQLCNQLYSGSPKYQGTRPVLLYERRDSEILVSFQNARL